MTDHLAFVIEDDFDASVIFAKALESIGFDIEMIASGELAVERLNEVVPDIVVLDLRLPEIGGVSILNDIRSDERLTNIKVIVTTADAELAEVINDLADIVLIKPTTYSQMRQSAERLLV